MSQIEIAVKDVLARRGDRRRCLDKMRRLREDCGRVWYKERNGARWTTGCATGLRHTYADAVEGVRIQHTGWFCRFEDNSEKYRGVVIQLPAHKGVVRALAAYEDSESEGLHVEMRIYNDMADAARAADALAEHYAEEARDHSEAWTRGREWRVLQDEIAEARATARSLIAEIKAAGKQFSPAICAALRSQLVGLRRQITTQRKACAELVGVSGWWAEEYRDVFNEGAEAEVI